MERDAVLPLVELGLTSLEAEIYMSLLRESPATGYRIAQSLGKPAANIYKAIGSLERKGAVLVDEGANRLCRAVPAREFLSHLERGFRSRRDEALEALSRLQGAPDDDRVYQLRSRDQVFERCRTMLGRCQQVAILDVFPGPLEELLPDIESAARRGVKVALELYAPASIAGVEIALQPRAPAVLSRWPGQSINLVVDGQEHLLAYLTRDGKEVHQSIWTGSAYLSWVYHSGAAAEFILAAIQKGLEEDRSNPDLRGELTRLRDLTAPEAPGYQRLRGRFSKGGTQ